MDIQTLAICVMIFLVFVVVHLYNLYEYCKAVKTIQKGYKPYQWEVVNSTLVNMKFLDVRDLEQRLRKNKRRFR